MENHVAVGSVPPRYCSKPPFHPDEPFPELPFKHVSGVPNAPYRLLRGLLLDLGLDHERHGTPEWNPLGSLIRPGQTVVIKPNFVLSRNDSGDNLFAVITHPSILRALVDYAYVALKGRGRIVIADAPQMDCDWDELMAAQHLDSIQALYRQEFNFNLEVFDLRMFAVTDYRIQPVMSNRKTLPGDPLGSVTVDLGPTSLLHGLPVENFYGADFDRTQTIVRHSGQRHEYRVSRTILSADTLIFVPKMKVHKKAGVTLNLKGLVGINTDKNCLVHFRLGTPSQGGDQLPDNLTGTDRLLIRMQRWLFDHLLARGGKGREWLYNLARRGYRLIRGAAEVSDKTRIQDSGNWHGNDSVWRMTGDLAQIIYYADRDGVIQVTPQRKMFSVVDGIIGGQDNGPLQPTAAPCGCLVAGSDPFAVDIVTTRLMGFDIRRLRQFSAVPGRQATLEDVVAGVRVTKEGREIPGKEFFDPSDRTPYYGFRPHPGWIGQIEIHRQPE